MQNLSNYLLLLLFFLSACGGADKSKTPVASDTKPLVSSDSTWPAVSEKTRDELIHLADKLDSTAYRTQLSADEFREMNRIMRSSDPNDWINGDVTVMDEIYFLIRSSYNKGTPGVVDEIYNDLIGELCKRTNVSETELLDMLDYYRRANNSTLIAELKNMGITNPFFTKTLGQKLNDRVADSKKLGDAFDDLNPSATRLKPKVAD